MPDFYAPELGSSDFGSGSSEGSIELFGIVKDNKVGKQEHLLNFTTGTEEPLPSSRAPTHRVLVDIGLRPAQADMMVKMEGAAPFCRARAEVGMFVSTHRFWRGAGNFDHCGFRSYKLSVQTVIEFKRNELEPAK